MKLLGDYTWGASPEGEINEIVTEIEFISVCNTNSGGTNLW